MKETEMPIRWNPIKEEIHIQQIVRQSYDTPQLIFKHSTRCSISALALGRLEKKGMNPSPTCHLLDLIAERPLSNAIAEQFRVHHESPQVLLIHNGECVYDESHLAIDPEDITEQLQLLGKEAL